MKAPYVCLRCPHALTDSHQLWRNIKIYCFAYGIICLWEEITTERWNLTPPLGLFLNTSHSIPWPSLCSWWHLSEAELCLSAAQTTKGVVHTVCCKPSGSWLNPFWATRAKLSCSHQRFEEQMATQSTAHIWYRKGSAQHNVLLLSATTTAFPPQFHYFKQQFTAHLLHKADAV